MSAEANKQATINSATLSLPVNAFYNLYLTIAMLRGTFRAHLRPRTKTSVRVEERKKQNQQRSNIFEWATFLLVFLFIYSSVALPPRRLLHSTQESSTQTKLITVILVAVRSEIIKHRFVVIHSYTYSSERSGGTLAVRHVIASRPGIRQHLCFLTGRVTAEVDPPRVPHYTGIHVILQRQSLAKKDGPGQELPAPKQQTTRERKHNPQKAVVDRKEGGLGGGWRQRRRG